MTISIKITGADCMPARAGVRPDRRFAYRGSAVHFPDRDRAVVVLPQNIGITITVKIAGSYDVPGRPGVRADQRFAYRGSAVHQPDCHLAVTVLPQNIGITITVKIAGSYGVPGRPGVAKIAVTDDGCPVHLPNGNFSRAVLP